MTEETNSKHYDLEDRTYRFAKDVRDYTKKLPRTISNIEYGKQLIRSAGSIAANYIEANEALSKKDFTQRIKICRKESKESILWLRLTLSDGTYEADKQKLIQESTELMKIFAVIFRKSQ